MKKILEYGLENSQLQVSILNIGASIKSIVFDGVERVVSYTDLDNYRINPFYLGSVIGQNSGRIRNANFELDGKTYELEKNDGLNNLHGGSNGLHTKFWDLVYYVNTDQEQRLKLRTESKDLEAGFPGNVVYEAEYFLDGPQLVLNLHAKSDKKTFVNLTNHVYFNLNKDKATSILNHSLRIDSSNYYPLAADGIPEEATESKESVFDLRQLKKISDLDFSTSKQTDARGGFDHPFKLDQSHAEIFCQDEGVTVEIDSNNPCLVLYTGCNIEEGYKLNGNIDSRKYLGLAMEMQEEVNYMNLKSGKDKALEANEDYNRYITWKFSKNK